MIIKDLIKKNEFREFERLLNKSEFSRDQLAACLIEAVWHEKEIFVRFLLKLGVNLNFVPDVAYPSLHCAVVQDSTTLVRLLIRNGCDVNLKDAQGQTPLHLAIDEELTIASQNDEIPEPFMSRLLIERGADPSIPDSRGNTPLD